MNHKLSSERLVEALEGSSRIRRGESGNDDSRELPTGSGPGRWTIALSREAGTNGPMVARAVAERLGWPVYDHELLEKVAHEMRLRPRQLEDVDEKHKSWLLETAEGFSSGRLLDDGAYAYHLHRTAQALAQRGSCVIVGRGAAHFLPPETTLRVRLVAPLAARIETVRTKFALTQEQARQWVEKTDADRLHFVKEHFQKDAADPRGYDLVLNTQRLQVPECVTLIVGTLQLMAAQQVQHT